ncbi:MAG: gamma-glutamyltransferase, partial [Candidatus Acidiferrales bacterium]
MKSVRASVMFVLLAGMSLLLGIHAQDRTQGRSMVVSRGGIVSAESPLAAQAGAMILAHGGNAIDAAVATNAVMGVVAPMMNGIGGDLFAIVFDAKTGKIYGINASGWSPAGLTIDFLKSRGITAMPQSGINSVTVPGVVDGWAKLLDRFGRKKLSEVLVPAIHFAQSGFPVPERTAEDWKADGSALAGDANFAKTYLPGGRSPKLGEVFQNVALAKSLEEIASGGRDA